MLDLAFMIAIQQVVEEVGRDHVYSDDERTSENQCRYVFGGRPSCLIGRALHRVGIDINDLLEFEGSNASTIMEELGFDDRVLVAADYAQQLQDDGRTWGDAIDRFWRTLDEELDF